MSFNFGASNGSGDKKPFSFGNTSTPAPNAPTNLFGGLATTTPAGPPPVKSTFSFGSSDTALPAASGENRSMFGAPASSTSENKPANAFSFGGLGNSSTPNSSFQTPTTDSTPKPFSFGEAATPSLGNQSGSSGFAGGNNNTAPTASKSAEASASTGGFSFGAKPADGPSSATGGSFSFGNPSQAQAPNPESAKSTTGGFSFGSTPMTNPAPETSKSAGGFSFGGSQPEEKKDAAPATTGGFSFGNSKPEEKKDAAPAATGGFSFGNSKPEEKKDAAPAATGGFSFGTSKPEEKKDAAPIASSGFSFGGSKDQEKKDAKATATTELGAKSISGQPAAPPPVSLKNKTMEDIINKWSADLDKYSQDFQKQAKQIAVWDQSLLASGDQISRLYSATVEAEQQSGKVDQALNYIENQQDELSQLLDSYEGQVRDITAEIGVTQPADQEREKAYSQAVKLVEDLNGTGKNLGQMITELNKSGEVMGRLKDDDPLSSIVKILNSQLQSLKWIDENAAKLNEKVEQLTNLQNTDVPKTPTNKFRFGSLRLE